MPTHPILAIVSREARVGGREARLLMRGRSLLFTAAHTVFLGISLRGSCCHRACTLCSPHTIFVCKHVGVAAHVPPHVLSLPLLRTQLHPPPMGSVTRATRVPSAAACRNSRPPRWLGSPWCAGRNTHPNPGPPRSVWMLRLGWGFCRFGGFFCGLGVRGGMWVSREPLEGCAWVGIAAGVWVG